MNRVITSVLIVVACTSFAACSSGGGRLAAPPGTTPGSASALSAAAYTQELKRIAAEENRAQHRVQAAFRANTAAQVRSAIAAFADDQQRVADELSSTVPPANARAANAALAQAFADNAVATREVVDRMAQAATAKAALHIIQSASSAQQSGREIDAALGRLRKLGYASGS